MTTDFIERVEAGAAQDDALAMYAAMTGAPADAGKAANEVADHAGEMPEDMNADNTVIESKNGRYTIPFEQLERSRQSAAQERHNAEQAMARVAELEAQLQAANDRQNAGHAPTQADATAQAAATAIEQGVDPELFGDFSEEALAKGITALNRREMAALREELRTELMAELAPFRQQQAVSATDAHFSTIYTAHPDADAVAESKELADWIGRQPSVARSAYVGVLEQGTASQLVEMFDAFKQDTGVAGRGADADLTAKAKAAVASARASAPVPMSLSEIPASRINATSADERLSAMSGIDMFNAAASGAISEAQMNAYLNRKS